MHLQQYILGGDVCESLGLVACVRGVIFDEIVPGFVQLSD
jgi:hypothetical protein